MKYIIILDITKDEFNRNFKDRIIPRRIHDIHQYWEKNVFIGKINNNKFYFYWKPDYRHNVFATIIKGYLLEKEEGNYIYYRYDKFLSVKIISAALSIISVCIGLLTLYLGQPASFIPFLNGLIIIIIVTIKPKKSRNLLQKQLMQIVEAKDN